MLNLTKGKCFTFHSNDVKNEALVEKRDFADFATLYYISELLPYDLDKKKGAELRNGLKEYQMLLAASLEALSALAKGDLVKFDSLVGENACEIRAVWIAIIFSKNLIDTKCLIKKIINIKDKVEELLDQKTISRLMHKMISLNDLIINENLLIRLSLEAAFIIQTFLLTESKFVIENPMLSICINEKCIPKQLKRFGDISSSFIDNLLRKSRKFVAGASVLFVRERSYKRQDKNLIKMLSDKFTINHNSYLPCTPMFWTYKSVLSATHEEKIPLIIHVKFLDGGTKGHRIVDEDWLFFEPVSDVNGNSTFIQRNENEVDYSKAACVVQGVVYPRQKKALSKFQWRQIMSKYSISKVILCGAADHRQYPDLERNELISQLQNHEYETYKSLAKSEGFSLDNPTTFFIQHVYSSQIGAISAIDHKMVLEAQAMAT